MSINVPTIETNRLKLRNINMNDSKDIVLWRSDSNVYRFFKSPHKITMNEHINWYNNNYLVNDNVYNWMAIDHDGNSVGIFGASKDVNDTDIVEISYILSPNHKGKGYARESILAILDFIQKHWNSKYIIAKIHKDNIDSISFIQNMGFETKSNEDNFLIFQNSIIDILRKNNKKILIRVDGNNNIGTGHVMRCLSIAKQLKNFNFEIIFVLADNSMEDIIKNNGFKTVCLNSKWDNLETEINDFCKLINDEKIEIVLIDSYFVTVNYLEKINNLTKVIYIDDNNERGYPVSGIINYNIYSDECKYNADNYELLLTGTQYTPLRDEFFECPKRIFNKVNNILITTGGTDNYNFMERFLDFILTTDKNSIYNLYCILGKYNLNLDKLSQKYKKHNNVHLLKNIGNMSEYMKKCDIAITAGGTTCYELCAMGIPSIIYTLADNQLKLATSFSEKNVMFYAGDIRENMDETINNIQYEINKLKDDIYWTEKSEKMQKMVDGIGAQRIAKIIYKKTIH